MHKMLTRPCVSCAMLSMRSGLRGTPANPASARLVNASGAGACHCREWQVRKAAANTLAGLCEAMLTGEAAQHAAADAPPCGSQQHQQQGLAALAGVVPAIAAAVEQHLKYDRIPQVRQAAAVVLQLLQRVPAMQPQEQRRPMQQLQPGMPRSVVGTAAEAQHAAADQSRLAALQEAAAGNASAPPISGPGRWQGDLRALIAERRRQLQASGEQAAAAAAKAWRLDSGSGVLGKPGLQPASGGSSTGSAEEGLGIFAWMDSMAAARVPAAQAAAVAAAPIGGGPESGVKGPTNGASMAAGGGSRPPSAEAFEVAVAALGRLASPERQQRALPATLAVVHRSGWASLSASPAKQGGPAKQSSMDLPVQMLVSRSPPPGAYRGGRAAAAGLAEDQGAAAGAVAIHMDQHSAHSVWRQNPLAEPWREPAGAGQEQRATAAACTHHLHTPQVGAETER